jgi:hypothetical protein
MIVVLLGIGLMLAMTTGIAGATTEVSGNQSGTWTLANSPYVVTGSVNVPAGQTLTIEPGVEVKFNDNQGIGVYGALNADGTSSQKITFTSNGYIAKIGTCFYIISYHFSADNIFRWCNLL